MKTGHTDPAFVGTKATLMYSSTKARICARQRRRNRPVRKWRCVVQDGSAGKSKDITQIEGAVPFDKFDAGLEEALSKGWDKLDNFDTPMQDDVVHKSSDNTQTTGDEKKDLQSSAEASDILATDSDLSMMDQPADPMMLESSAPKDEPSSTTVDTKPKTKRKRRSAKKKPPEPKKQMTDIELKESVQWSAEPRWFFVQVKPGCEQSTAVSIRNLSNSLETSQIREVLVPTTTIMRLTKGGKSVKKEERFFPSYILVLMVMNRRNYSEILAVPNVQFFMGDPNRDKKKDAPLRPPLPVKDSEMKNVFEKIEEAQSAKPEVKTTIRPGDSIKVISGSFTDNVGTVLEVKPDLNVVKANLIIFGRKTAVDLEFKQVEVVDDVVEEPEAENNLGATENHEDSKRLRGRGKSIPGSRGRRAEIAARVDDLVALLEDTGSDNSERTEDYDADESDVELTQSEDDRFGEPEITGGYEDGGFSSAEIDDDESEDSTVSKDPVARKTSGSKDELAELLSDDYSASSEWDSHSDLESSESDELHDLDEFFSSLDDLDEEAEKNDEASSFSNDTDTESVQEDVTLNRRRSREVSEEELMRRMEEPISSLDDEDDLGFSAQSILADVDDLMAEVVAGKRKVGPQEEDHDLSKSLIETTEELSEIDLFAMPDLDGHNDPDSSADPAPRRG